MGLVVAFDNKRFELPGKLCRQGSHLVFGELYNMGSSIKWSSLTTGAPPCSCNRWLRAPLLLQPRMSGIMASVALHDTACLKAYSVSALGLCQTQCSARMIHCSNCQTQPTKPRLCIPGKREETSIFDDEGPVQYYCTVQVEESCSITVQYRGKNVATAVRKLKASL